MALPDGWSHYRYQGKKMPFRVDSDCGEYRIYKQHFDDGHKYQLWGEGKRIGPLHHSLNGAIQQWRQHLEK